MIFLGLVCTETPAVGDRLALSRGPALTRSPWRALSITLSSICRWVHNWPQTPHRFAPPALPPVPLLQQPASRRGGLRVQGPRPPHGEQCHCTVHGCQDPAVRGPYWGENRGRGSLGMSYPHVFICAPSPLSPVIAVKAICKSWLGGAPGKSAGCACVCQTDVRADGSHLDALRAGTRLPLKQLQSHGAGNGRRSLQKERSLPCTGGASGPELHPALGGQGARGQARQQSPRTGVTRFYSSSVFSSPGSEAR